MKIMWVFRVILKIFYAFSIVSIFKNMVSCTKPTIAKLMGKSFKHRNNLFSHHDPDLGISNLKRLKKKI